MKTCSKCKITKEFNEFQKDKSKLDGYRYHCKACKKALSKSHTITHLHQGAKYSKEWKAKYPEKAIAQKAKRRAAKLQRTVSWANSELINEFYAEAKRLTELTGISFHVDHIIPLQGTTVSGLHVENNLQVLPYYENCKKGNRY
jgi:hypothetical protein